MRVAYLVSQYPALSHAFIETEVAALRSLGAEVHTFSVRPSQPAELLTDRARAEATATCVLQSGALRSAPRALLALARRSPAALGVGLVAALRSGPRTLRARTWQVFYLVEAIVLWWRMSRAELRHLHVHFANNSADIARLTVTLGLAANGAGSGWSWSLAMHGPTEFEDRSRFDLEAKVASASSVACISDFCRSQIMRLLPPSQWKKAGLVRMAVDTSRYRPAAKEDLPAPGSPLRILTVGRLVPEKGAPLLVDAVDRMRTAGVPVNLTVVGAGPLHGELSAMVRARGLDELVHLLGPVGQEQLPELYRQADVFVLPSFAEGLPVVLMEAMASGLPVITTAIAGIPELVIDHHTGLLLPPGRADLIAEALTELVTDPLLTHELGVNGRAAVLRLHDPQGNARRLIELFPGCGAKLHTLPSGALSRP